MFKNSEIDIIENKITKEIHADSVLRDIESRENKRSRYEKRWFWELLQNAIDSIDKTENIKIKLEVFDNKISFSHTGNPFKIEDIFSLIIQGSSKDDGEKVGRFGTGFLTTYLLSKEVEITGTLIKDNEKRHFNFLLNRNSSDKVLFRKLQEESIQSFKNSFIEDSYLQNTEFQTKFTYILDENGRQTAKKGLECLDELIHITQLFNEQIESVTVIEKDTSITYTKSLINEHNILDAFIKEWKVTTKVNDALKVNYNAYVLQHSDYSVCVITQIENNKETIFQLTSSHPRLFFTFPLLGTEEMGIPIIINSTKFHLGIERDEVFLDSNSSNEKIKQNKEILSNAIINSCQKFAYFFTEKNMQNSFCLFDFYKSNYKWIDQEWFNKTKMKTIEILSEIDFLSFYDEKDNFVNLKNLEIPYTSNTDMIDIVWNLLNNIKSFKVPLKEDLCYWIQIMNNIKEIRGDVNVYELEYVWKISDIVDYIKRNFSSLEELNAVIQGSATQWLNELYFALKETKEFQIKDAILLNQENKLRIADGMFWDACKDIELVEISNLLHLNFSNKLISQDIIEFEIIGVKNFTLENAIAELRDKLNSLEAIGLEKPEYIAANAKFLRWLIKNDREDVIKDLKVLRNDGMEYVIFSTNTHLLLSPKSFFGSKYPLFKELIRDKDCLHDDYANILDSDDFNFLNNHGFLHQWPLVVKKESASKEMLRNLGMSENDLALLCNDDGKLKEENKVVIDYSDFAYLTTNDDHIYSRNKSRDSSYKLLEFLFLEAPENDDFFLNDIQTITIEGRKEIYLKKCLWIYRAKKIKWINVNTRNENGKIDDEWKEYLSSSNISELLKEKDKDLFKKLSGEKQQKLLSCWGIGVSELIRNSFPEEKKQSWDQAIASMLVSKIEPIVALEIFNDPHIQEVYEKRIKTKELISRNQKIGYLVEELFKELIKSTELINIIRKPCGSDYLLYEFDLINIDNKQEGFQINNLQTNDYWLVELKATGKDYAAMTELQAKKAVEEKDNYALIIVELDGEPDIEYLRKNAKVISNIGYKIESIYFDFQDVTTKKDNLLEGLNGISVNFDEQNVRFRINSKIWREETQTIEIFLKEKFNQ